MRFPTAELTRRRVALMLCLPSLLEWNPASGAERPPGVRPSPAMVSGTIAESAFFDLPAQPLASALNHYATISGQSVMFPDALVAGQTSSAIRGRYAPQAALRALLAGTGLVADEVSGERQQAFVLRKPDLAATGTAPGVANVARSYDGLVQARVWEALCADTRTAPGRYRAIVRFGVDASGHLHQATLLHTSGDADRDAAMLATLGRLRMDRSPPATLAQPLTLVILPQDVLPGPGCQNRMP